MQVVDLFTGEHYEEPYTAINPNKLVPVLEDGDFRLTESSAILKYLADKIGSPAYPKDLKQRARVNEVMDWFNTDFYRDFGYGLVYPQIFPHLSARRRGAGRRPSPGARTSEELAAVLERPLDRPNKQYLCGDEITIADYFGARARHRVGEVIALRLQGLSQRRALARQHEERCRAGRRSTRCSTASPRR